MLLFGKMRLKIDSNTVFFVWPEISKALSAITRKYEGE